jgi:hypothetical protein
MGRARAPVPVLEAAEVCVVLASMSHTSCFTRCDNSCARSSPAWQLSIGPSFLLDDRETKPGLVAACS